MTLTSPAFANRKPIPSKQSHSGANVSPPLTWTKAPTGTQSFAIVVQDIDAHDPGLGADEIPTDLDVEQAEEARQAGYTTGAESAGPPPRTFCHWLVYGIRADATELDEGIPRTDKLRNGILQGQNDFGQLGYGGPQPPSGTHRYLFRLFALDTVLPLAPGAVHDELDNAMRGHIIEEAQLTGIYRKD